MRFNHMILSIVLCLLLALSGCGRSPGGDALRPPAAATLPEIAGTSLAGTEQTTKPADGTTPASTEWQTMPEETVVTQPATQPEETAATQPEAAAPSEPEPTQPEPTQPPVAVANGYVVVIDPGHQTRGDSVQEPLGPGSNQMKKRVSSGTTGTATGLPEYKLNLTIGLALREELLARGYTVYMTRETHDVNISNMERALYASKVGGDILVRIHANGNDNPDICGALTICQTKQNPYQNQYESSKLLSEKVLDAYCKATGIAKKHVWETDTMTGINWCSIPSTIVEMGYMSNADDDRKMSDPDMQRQMVRGIADGIDEYFAAR